MTDAESRAYARGYAAGRKKAWPAHMPPLPVESPLVAALMDASRKLRDGLDAMLSMFDEDDPMEDEHGIKIAAFDAAMEAITKALTEQPKDGA